MDILMSLHKKWANKILDGSSYLATESRFDNFTETDFTTFMQNQANISSVGGELGKNAFFNIFEDIKNNPELTKEVNSLMAEVNWLDSSSVKEFNSKLIELGVLNSENISTWAEFTNNLHNGMTEWIDSSDKVINNLKTIKEIAGDLKAGDIISEEDFKALLKIAPEVATNFIKTAEGYKLLTSGKDLNKQLKDQYKNLDQIEQKYKQISNAAKSVSINNNFKAEEFSNSGKTNIINWFSQDRKDLADALEQGNSEKINEWIKALGTEFHLELNYGCFL